MCGIVAYIGHKQAQQIILNGLSRLAYRGYDSAGLAILDENGQVVLQREVGKLAGLAEIAQSQPLSGTTGIGHTRWATHGPPTVYNAHPHTSMKEQVVLVHNGILENFITLRDELKNQGIKFDSDTDTEVIVQLIECYMDAGADFESAVRETLARLEGSNAIVVMSTKEPEQIICARLGNAGGVTLGIGEGEMFISSDIPAIVDYTDTVAFLDAGQMATVTADYYSVSTVLGERVVVEEVQIPWGPSNALKGEYSHYMLKEIYEQPQAIVDTMRHRVDFENSQILIPELKLESENISKLERIYIVACGSSYYAGLVGKHFIEKLARIPVEVAYGSEFRYSEPIIDAKTAVLAITQSGETADTLAACELAKRNGATLWSIVNVLGSQAMRMADGYISMQAGPEIGVATTKAFTASILDLYLLACLLGIKRKILDDSALRKHIRDLLRLPSLVGQILEETSVLTKLADEFYRFENFLYIGRGNNYPIALEGALKLKEISYIHAEGYPAGEMKHGPISLIEKEMPIVAIATSDRFYTKMISQIEQASARGGTVIALASEGDQAISKSADHVIYVPAAPPLLSPIVNIVPLQLLAFYIAVHRECDIDQPRNLAKSVTVE